MSKKEDRRITKSRQPALDAIYEASDRARKNGSEHPPRQEDIADICKELGSSRETFYKRLKDDDGIVRQAVESAKTAWEKAAPSQPNVKDTKHYESTIKKLRETIANLGDALVTTNTELQNAVALRNRYKQQLDAVRQEFAAYKKEHQS